MPRWVPFAAALTLLALAAPGYAQVRSNMTISSPRDPGSLRTLGGQFYQYSTGVGGLQRNTSYNSGVDPLRSNVYTPGVFGVTRGAGSANTPLSGLVSGTGTNSIFPGVPRLTGTVKPGAGVGPPDLDFRALSALPAPTLLTRTQMAQAYTGPAGIPSADGADNADEDLFAAARNHALTLEAKAPPILTSLAPTGDDVPAAGQEPKRNYLREFMQEGEASVKSERYLAAEDSFEQAMSFARYTPGTQLSLVHAEVPLERYHSAAAHLRNALTYFPELPLARIKLRGFYSGNGEFVKHLTALRQNAAVPGDDPEAYLLLAYFEYFDDEPAKAAADLQEAWKRTTDPDLRKDLQTFWIGMAAAGKTSPGAPGLETTPQTDTQPTTMPPPAAPLP